MFELPMKTVHSIVTKMIIKEELLVCVMSGSGVGGEEFVGGGTQARRSL